MPLFPSSVPTALQLLDARNNKSVTLSAAINDVITTIPVTDTSNIPTSGYLTFEDGSNEVIQYTGVTPTSLTGVTRGADGTTASSHGNGGTIGMWGNARYHNILAEEIIGICQNLSDRLGLSATQILAPSGVAGAPSYSFAGDLDTGMWHAGADEICFSTNGILRGFWRNGGIVISSGDVQFDTGNTGHVYNNDGLIATPAYSFALDPNTGMWRSGPDALCFSAGGILPLYCETTGSNILLTPGIVSVPSLRFLADTNTGIYQPTADAIGFSAGGTLIATINSSGLTVNSGALTATVLFADGSASNPSITFASDLNTGMYRMATDRLAIVAGGVESIDVAAGSPGRVEIYNVRLLIGDGSLSVPHIAFSLDTNSGICRTGTDSWALVSNGARALEITASQAVLIRGTSTNDDAVAGDVGEFVSSNTGNVAAPATTTWGDITSISLTAGDWDISLIVVVNSTAYASITDYECGISVDSGNSFTDGTQCVNLLSMAGAFPPYKINQTIGRYRKKLSATTTIYAKHRFYYAAGTHYSVCGITARRVR